MITTSRPLFQIKSHSWVPGVVVRTDLLRIYHSTHYPSKIRSPRQEASSTCGPPLSQPGSPHRLSSALWQGQDHCSPESPLASAPSPPSTMHCSSQEKKMVFQTHHNLLQDCISVCKKISPGDNFGVKSGQYKAKNQIIYFL